MQRFEAVLGWHGESAKRPKSCGGADDARSARTRYTVERPRREFTLVGRPKVGLGIYIYSCHAGELFGFVPVARDEQAFSC